MTAAAADIFVRSSLLLALAWVAAAAVGRAGGSAAMRYSVWLCGLCAAMLLPFASALLPPLRLAILPAPAVDVAALGAAPAPGPDLAVISLAADSAWWVYLAIAAVLLVRLALGRLALGRLWARSSPAAPVLAAQMEELRGALGIRRPVALRLADGPVMPMTWGSIRPRVLLPAEAARWTRARHRIVLLHELAHVARGDDPSRLAASAACALYWFQPAFWLATRRMRREQELACDDLVLSRGAPADHYARELLAIAREFRPPIAAAALAIGAAHPSELERRLTSIVGRTPRRRAGARFAACSFVAALGAALTVATVVPVAASAPRPRGGEARSLGNPLGQAPSWPGRSPSRGPDDPGPRNVRPAAQRSRLLPRHDAAAGPGRTAPEGAAGWSEQAVRAVPALPVPPTPPTPAAMPTPPAVPAVPGVPAPLRPLTAVTPPSQAP